MDVILKLFGTTNLYQILQISTETVGDEKVLKSAYLRAALKYHPDKGAEDERQERTNKFQIIQQIFEMLKDGDLRKSYEETGEWPDKEELILESSPFGKLDAQTILDFKKNYIGSEEEREDVKNLYEEGQGDILFVLDNLYFANIIDDEGRVQEIIDDLIETEEMEKLGTGVVDKKARDKKIKKAKKEAAEAEKLSKELNLGGMGDLKTAVAKNAAGRSNFLDDLEKKYGGAEKNGKGPKASGSKGRGRPAKKSAPVDDEDEEEEEVIQPKAKKGRGRPGKKSAPVVDDEEEETDEEVAQPKAKNGRGPPAKKSAPVNDEEEETDEEVVQPKAKKGRGRPAKKSAPVDDDDEEEVVQPKAKNGRGPPAKKSAPVVDEEDEDDEDAENGKEEEELVPPPPKAKKGRGRPAKVAHSDDEADDDNVPKAKKLKSEEPAKATTTTPKGKGRGRPAKAKK